MRGKEDPFLKIGETNDRTTSGGSNVVWSLKDINFEIEQGDAVGIIGRNGAGKSTLLKILSRITSPTTGDIKIRGRIASLLEVGTGFHPELTGRENIYLNGAILGMRKKEITRKFDEMVDFAGIERYVDTPVKRYSSGMYVRLAFAVAAHLESEILIVDEVLAVGDAEFQKKCLGKMGEVSKGEGRTVLFVSHNMAAIEALTSQVLYLQNGKNLYMGEVKEGISNYYAVNKIENEDLLSDRVSYNKDELIFKSIRLMDIAVTGADLTFEVIVESAHKYPSVSLGIVIKDVDGFIITTLFTRHNDQIFPVKEGLNIFKSTISQLPLIPGKYFVNLWSAKEGNTTSDYVENAMSFVVEQGDFYNTGFVPGKSVHGSICINNKWSNVSI